MNIWNTNKQKQIMSINSFYIIITIKNILFNLHLFYNYMPSHWHLPTAWEGYDLLFPLS